MNGAKFNRLRKETYVKRQEVRRLLAKRRAEVEALEAEELELDRVMIASGVTVGLEAMGMGDPWAKETARAMWRIELCFHRLVPGHWMAIPRVYTDRDDPFLKLAVETFKSTECDVRVVEVKPVGASAGA